MLIKALFGLSAVAVALVGVVATRPSEYRVSRTTSIAAPPSAVFAQVNDFHNWSAWNPWGKIDPAMTQAFAGEASGKGAVYTWVGNREVGEGRMTIVESSPHERIRIALEFFKPFAGTSEAEFTFRPTAEGTTVTWSMTGANNFMAKAIHMVIDMDRMIGGNFEKGLAHMKSVVESRKERG